MSLLVSPLTNLRCIQITHSQDILLTIFWKHKYLKDTFNGSKLSRFIKPQEYCEIKDPLPNWIYSLYLASIWTLASSYFCVLCKMCSCCIGWERGFVQKAPTITPHITTGSASFWQEMAQYLVIWTHRRPWQRKDLQMKTCLSSHNFFLKTDWNQKVFIRLQSLHFREGSSPPRQSTVTVSL